MAGIAKFAIMFTANASGVEQGVNRAEKSLRGLSGAAGASAKSMGALGDGIAKVGASLAGLAAGAITIQKIGDFVLSAVDRIDQLGDRAEALDEIPDNLNAIEYAAVRMGSSAQAVAAGMTKMVKTLGDAKMNGGPAAEAINKIGLSLDYLTSLSPAEAIISIAAALAKIPNTYERAALASKIFGRGASELGAVLKLGGDQLQGYLDRYEDLNATLTGESVQAASDAQDAIDDLSTAFAGLGNVVIAASGGNIKGMADDLSGVVSNLSKSAEFASKIETSFEGMRLTLGVLIDGTNDLARAWGVITGAVKIAYASTWAVGAAVKSVFGKDVTFLAEMAGVLRDEGIADIMGVSQKSAAAVSDIASSGAKAKTSIEESSRGMNGAIGSVDETADETADKIKGIGTASEDAAKVVIKTAAQMADTAMIANAASGGGLESFWDALEKAFTGDGSLHKETLDAMGEFFDDATKRMRDFGDSLTEEMKNPMEKFEDRMNAINDAFDRGTISVETYNRASKKAFEDLQSASGIDAMGGDEPGMMGGIDPALQRMIDFSMPAGGFVGGVMPTNFRLFSPPEDGARQTVMASDVLDSAGVPYFDKQMGEDPQLADANRYLQQIAQNTATPQAVY